MSETILLTDIIRGLTPPARHEFFARCMIGSFRLPGHLQPVAAAGGCEVCGQADGSALLREEFRETVPMGESHPLSRPVLQPPKGREACPAERQWVFGQC